MHHKTRIPFTRNGFGGSAAIKLEPGAHELTTQQVTFAGFVVDGWRLESLDGGEAGAVSVTIDGEPLITDEPRDLLPNQRATMSLEVVKGGTFSAALVCVAPVTHEPEPEEPPHVNTRIPREIYKVITAAAKQNRQSVQSYIADVLTAHIGDGEPAALALLGVSRGRVVLALRDLARALEPEADPVLLPSSEKDDEDRAGFVVMQIGSPRGVFQWDLFVDPVVFASFRVLGFEVEVSGAPCVVVLEHATLSGGINLLPGDQPLTFEPADFDAPNTRRVTGLRSNPTLRPGVGISLGVCVHPSLCSPETARIRMVVRAIVQPLRDGLGGEG